MHTEECNLTFATNHRDYLCKSCSFNTRYS